MPRCQRRANSCVVARFHGTLSGSHAPIDPAADCPDCSRSPAALGCGRPQPVRSSRCSKPGTCFRCRVIRGFHCLVDARDFSCAARTRRLVRRCEDCLAGSASPLQIVISINGPRGEAPLGLVFQYSPGNTQRALARTTRASKTKRFGSVGSIVALTQ